MRTRHPLRVPRLISLAALLGLWAAPLYAQGTYVYTNDDVNSYPYQDPNTVSAFAVDANGVLTAVPGSPFLTGGNGIGGGFYASNRVTTCAVANFLYVANAGSSDVSGFSIDPATGVLTPVPGSPFPTGGSGGIGISLASTPDGQFLIAANDGSQDITVFRKNADGSLTPITGSPFYFGFEPDGIKVSPDGRFLAVAVPFFGGVAMFSIGPDGSLTPVPNSPFVGAGSTTGVDVNCASDRLFGSDSNGDHTIVDVFNLAADGTLAHITGSPFNFYPPDAGANSNVPLLSPDDGLLFVSNQASDSVTAFTVAGDGSLALVPGSPFTVVGGYPPGNPAGMGTDPDGRFLFVTSFVVAAGVTNMVGVFSIGADGALTAVPGSPFVINVNDLVLDLSLAVYPPKSCTPLGLSTRNMNFGDQHVGVPSDPRTVTVTNHGTIAINISSIGTTPGSDFALSNNTCPAGLAPAGSCNFDLTFTPTARHQRTDDVTIISDARGSPHTVHLTGNGVAPEIYLSVTSLSFGDQVVGTSSPTQTIVVSNNGDLPLNITSITSDSADFHTLNNCPASLPPNQGPTDTCQISSQFVPTAAGTRNGQITITTDDPSSPQTVTLSGNGIGPTFTPSGTSLAFGSQPVGGSSTPQTVVISNTGNAVLTISNISLSGDFTLAPSNTCVVGSLAPEGNCNLDVAFSPTVVGNINGLILITDNAPGSPHLITLSGTGTGPAFTPSATSLAFGNQRKGTTSAPQTVLISNTGTATLNILTLSVSPDFTLDPTNTCVVGSVAAGGSCNLKVSFSPSVLGNISGQVLITDNAPGSPHFITLSGTGVQPAVVLSTTSVDFPGNPINLDCPGRTVTLTNAGTDTLYISSVVPSSSVFRVTNGCGASVAPGVSCDIIIKFYGPEVGSYSGTVAINDDASDSPQVINITATATPFCFLQASAQQMTIVRGSDTATFGISDQNPSCSPIPLELSCTIDSPASCEFNPSTIPPTGSSSLRVKGLSRVQADFFNFIANKRAEFRNASLALTVLFSDFAFSTASPSASVVAGGSASYALTVRPTNGLTGRVSLACSGAPRGATCTVSPAAVMLNGANLAHLTVNVSTTSRSSAGPGTGPQTPPAFQWPSPSWFLWLLALAVLASLALARRRRARLSGMILTATLLLVLAWAACGGGGSMSSGNFGTPAGTYSLTVTGTYTSAAGDLSRSQSLSLTVN